MKKYMNSRSSAVLLAAVGLSLAALPTSADVLLYEPFDYTAPSTFPGTALNSFGFNNAADPNNPAPTETYQSQGGTDTNSQIVSGSLAGSLTSTGNSLEVQTSTRGRAIIDRNTAAFQASGVLEQVTGNELVGADGSTLYGSVLMLDARLDKAPFMGMEFAVGDPSANRSIIIGDDESISHYDQNAGGNPLVAQIPLVGAGSTTTQEIIFRIDYGASNVDTFTLIDPNTFQDVPGTLNGDFTFSTIHWAAFGGSGAVVWDEFRLGTSIVDVASIMQGDIDLDGDVDLVETGSDPNDPSMDGISDFDIIRANFFTAGGYTDGDLSNNGTVGLEDYRLWKDAFNATNFSALGVGVPEPSTLVLITTTCLLGIGLNRRRSTDVEA